MVEKLEPGPRWARIGRTDGAQWEVVSISEDGRVYLLEKALWVSDKDVREWGDVLRPPQQHPQYPRNDSRCRLLALAESFPALQPFIDRWRDGDVLDLELVADFVLSDAASDGELLAAAFILSVWNRAAFEERGITFDVIRAFGLWDAGNRAAFIAWAKEGWLP